MAFNILKSSSRGVKIKLYDTCEEPDEDVCNEVETGKKGSTNRLLANKRAELGNHPEEEEEEEEYHFEEMTCCEKVSSTESSFNCKV